MNTPQNNGLEPTSSGSTSLMRILHWLKQPPSPDNREEFKAMREYIDALRSAKIKFAQKLQLSEFLHERILAQLNRIQDIVGEIRLPVPVQYLELITLVDETLLELVEFKIELIDVIVEGQESHLLSEIISKTLRLLGYRIAYRKCICQPPSVGVWDNIYRLYQLSVDQDVANNVVGSDDNICASPKEEFLAILSLSCPKSEAFASDELLFAYEYIRRSAIFIDHVKRYESPDPAMYWINLARDAGPMTVSRSVPSDVDSVLVFSNLKLAAYTSKILNALEKSMNSEALDIPKFSESAAGKATLKRLIKAWTYTGKRRFPRRKQEKYSALLKNGIQGLWDLFKDSNLEGNQTMSAASEQFSDADDNQKWVVTNESAEGLSVQVINPVIGSYRVGDAVALKTDKMGSWFIALLRWVISDNESHLELGLQLLSPEAKPVQISVDGEAQGEAGGQFMGLLLPAVPSLRTSEALMVPQGLMRERTNMVMTLLDSDGQSVKSLKPSRVNEQTGSIEVFDVQ